MNTKTQDNNTYKIQESGFLLGEAEMEQGSCNTQMQVVGNALVFGLNDRFTVAYHMGHRVLCIYIKQKEIEEKQFKTQRRFNHGAN